MIDPTVTHLRHADGRDRRDHDQQRHLYKSTPFGPVKDFAPVINAAANIIGLAVNAEVPVHSVCRN